MMKLILALLATILLAVSPAVAEPKFGDYPTKMYLKGKPVLPKFAGSAAQFKSRIRNGMKFGSNYGGHFSLIEIGCGTSCIFAFLIDGRDGRLVDFPLAARTTTSFSSTTASVALSCRLTGWTRATANM